MKEILIKAQKLVTEELLLEKSQDDETRFDSFDKLSHFLDTEKEAKAFRGFIKANKPKQVYSNDYYWEPFNWEIRYNWLNFYINEVL